MVFIGVFFSPPSLIVVSARLFSFVISLGKFFPYTPSSYFVIVKCALPTIFFILSMFCIFYFLPFPFLIVFGSFLALPPPIRSFCFLVYHVHDASSKFKLFFPSIKSLFFY